MSETVTLGSRVRYRGRDCVVVGSASYLQERRWFVRFPLGESRTGWASDVALESALSEVQNPTWEVGASVRVGWGDYRRSGTVEAVTVREDGRRVYSVRLPAEVRETEQGTRWLRDSHLVMVGADEIETRGE